MIDLKVVREGEHVQMVVAQAGYQEQTFLYDLMNASDQHG